MTSGSWMRLMIFISQPHRGQLRGSTSQIPAFAGTSFLYELPPGLGRYPPRLVLGHIEHCRLGMALGGRRLITKSEDPSLISFSSTSA
jgi:hypothetical protein